MDCVELRSRSRRRIGVPKGILRRIAIDILDKRKAMSGTELMDEIEYYTDWRPSPGSIYPLLSKLEEEGFTELVESDDPSLKRYALTKSGVKSIEEHRNLEPDVRSLYHSMQKIYWKLFIEMPKDLFESLSRLLKSVETIHLNIRKDSEASSRMKELLSETAEEIENINRRLDKPV